MRTCYVGFKRYREYRMNILQPIVGEFEVLDDQGRELDERISQVGLRIIFIWLNNQTELNEPSKAVLFIS